MGFGPIENWTQATLAQAERDLATIGADAQLTKRQVCAKYPDIPFTRVNRAKTLAYRRRSGVPPAPLPRSGTPAPLSQWDDDIPTQSGPTDTEFERIPIPEDETAEISDQDLIAQQIARYERAKAQAATRGVRQLRVVPGPYAIAHFGDPHLDDDGCDMPAVVRALGVVSKTYGMYAGNVGDTTNNWVGKLVRLYGEQGATIAEAWQLARWFLRSARWLYIVGGNHDQWNGGMAVMKLLTEGCKIGALFPSEVRLELLSPGVKEPLRLHVRHDFPGSSIWNRAHGPMRASKLDGWADIYVAGHRHEWVDHREECVDGRVRWAIRARGFKRFDSYARDLGLFEQKHGDVVTTVVDPRHPHPAERVQVYLDIEEAAEVLAWKRKRRAA